MSVPKSADHPILKGKEHRIWILKTNIHLADVDDGFRYISIAQSEVWDGISHSEQLESFLNASFLHMQLRLCYFNSTLHSRSFTKAAKTITFCTFSWSSPLERVWGILFSFLGVVLSGFPMTEDKVTRTKSTESIPLSIFTSWKNETFRYTAVRKWQSMV